MKVNVLVKSIADGSNKLVPVPYHFQNGQDGIGNVEELIQETVKICLQRYKERMEDGQEYQTPAEACLISGKAVYGMYSRRKPPRFGEAVRTALEAFEDGTVAIFVDGKKMETLTDPTGLREESEVVFVKLAPLSASCLLVDWMN